MGHLPNHKKRSVLNKIAWIISIPFFIVTIPIAAVWNYGDPLRRKKRSIK